jgi:hypothetical protein
MFDGLSFVWTKDRADDGDIKRATILYISGEKVFDYELENESGDKNLGYITCVKK